MIQATRTARYVVAAVLLASLPMGTARAQDNEVTGPQGRYELWMGPTWWPGLGDVQPGEGHFDSMGLGLGFAFHFPARQFEHSDLLVGFDLSVTGVDSDIGGFLSTVMARQLFFGLSAKWLTFPDRNLSLDAGVGYYDADMAEVSTRIFGLENEIWSSSRAGAWAGIGWDVSQGRRGERMACSLPRRRTLLILETFAPTTRICRACREYRPDGWPARSTCWRSVIAGGNRGN